MDILKALHKEERKLLRATGKIEGQLRGIRAAINALSSNGVAARGSKLRGRKLSAAHRRAIKEGIARAKRA